MQCAPLPTQQQTPDLQDQNVKSGSYLQVDADGRHKSCNAIEHSAKPEQINSVLELHSFVGAYIHKSISVLPSSAFTAGLALRTVTNMYGTETGIINNWHPHDNRGRPTLQSLKALCLRTCPRPACVCKCVRGVRGREEKLKNP